MKQRRAPVVLLPERVCTGCGATFRTTDDAHRLCEKCHARTRLYVWRRRAATRQRDPGVSA